ESERREFNNKFARDIAEVKSIISEIQVGASTAYEQIRSKWCELNKTYNNEIKYLETQMDLQTQVSFNYKKEIAKAKQQQEQKDKIGKQLADKKAESEDISIKLNTENDFLHLI